VNEDALAVRSERPSDVVVGVDDRIPGIAVAYLKVGHIMPGAVDKVVGVTRTGFEPRAHAGAQRRLARIRHQNGLTLDDVDEFILAHMGVAQRRHAARRQARQVHSEIGQTEGIAERPPFAPRHPRGEGLGIAAAGAAARHRSGFDRGLTVSDIPSSRAGPFPEKIMFRPFNLGNSAAILGRKAGIVNLAADRFPPVVSRLSSWPAE